MENPFCVTVVLRLVLILDRDLLKIPTQLYTMWIYIDLKLKIQGNLHIVLIVLFFQLLTFIHSLRETGILKWNSHNFLYTMKMYEMTTDIHRSTEIIH